VVTEHAAGCSSLIRVGDGRETCPPGQCGSCADREAGRRARRNARSSGRGEGAGKRSGGAAGAAEAWASEESAKTAQALAAFEQLAQRLEAMAAERGIKPWWQWALRRAG
jgi:hypothetical protein